MPEHVAELAGDLGLADAGRPGEQVGADRLLRLAQAGAGQLDGAGQRADRRVLAEHHRLQVALQRRQRLAVVGRHALRRDAGDLGHHLLDVAHGHRRPPPVLRQQHARRTDLVDDVDRLVRQLAVVDVAGRQLDRGAQRVGRVLHLVMVLEAGLQAVQDLDGVLHRRLVDVDLLEAPDQRPVLLEVVAVLLVGRRAHAAQVARRQRRLQDVGCVHRAAAGGAGADHGVDLVDEQDGARRRLQLGDDVLQPLLEVAAVAGAGQQRAHVEGEDGRGLEHVGHLAADDAPGQAFGQGRLADAGIADEQRVVLVAPAEDLDGPFDLRLAADQRIDPAVGRLPVQVHAVAFQSFMPLANNLLAAAFVVGAMHRSTTLLARNLGDAVGDVSSRHRGESSPALARSRPHVIRVPRKARPERWRRSPPRGPTTGRE